MAVLLISLSVFLSIFSFVQSFDVEYEFTTFLASYLRTVDNPTFVVSMLCWNIKDYIALSNALSKVGKSYANLRDSSEILPLGDPEHSLFLIDFKCEGFSKRFIEADRKQLFKAPYRWLIFYDEEANSSDQNYTSQNRDVNILPWKLTNELNKYPILPDSDVVVAVRKEINDIFLKSVFKLRSFMSLKDEYLGQWVESELKFSEMAKVSAVRRLDLENIVLHSSIVITDNNTHKHLTDYRDKHIDTITKANYPLANHLIDFVNGSRQFSFVGSWGYKQNDGSWSGMIGELNRMVADIGGTPLFMTADRLNVIEYISVTTPTRSKFIFRSPPLSYVDNIFLLPFSKGVWIASLVLVMIVGAALYMTSKWEDQPEKLDYVQVDENRLHGTVSDIVLFSLSAVCQQGSYNAPKSPSGRILTIFLFVSLMFLYTSYSANIVALLQSSTNSITTLEHLLKSRLKLGIDDTVYNHYYFPRETEPIRRALWLQKIAPPGQPPKYINMSEGIAQMRKGLFAFHVELGVGYKRVAETFKEDEKCGLMEIEYLQVTDPWFAIQKNSSFKEQLKLGMRRIQEHGLQFREVGRLYTRRPRCAGIGASFGSVGIADAMYPFLWLLIGYTIAVAVLVIEILLNRLMKRHFNQNSRSPEFVRNYHMDSTDQAIS